VRGEYPFVQLDGHRASCAICLLDFQEPKRVSEGALKTVEDKTDSEAHAHREENEVPTAGENEEEVEEEGDVTEQATSPYSLNGDNLRLQDAGQGAQPLRLLKCGHVFHVGLFVLGARTALTIAATENMRGSMAHRRIGPLSGVSATCTRKRARRDSCSYGRKRASVAQTVVPEEPTERTCVSVMTITSLLVL
jgi:hypothetical protein